MLIVIAAYLLGSVSFAVVASKVFRLADPRTYGSKNPGATNVLRSGHKFAAGLTLAGDCAKGWLAVWLAVQFSEQLGLQDAGIALVAAAVFAGHLWPVFFRFVGGKGVATALGVLLGLNIWLGVATLVTWVVVAYAFRYSSLAALASAVFAPFYYALLFGLDVKLLTVLVMSGLLVYRHRKNIASLISGKESRLGAKSTADNSKKTGKKS